MPANVRKAINAQCAALGLPPAASDLEVLGYAASLLTKACARLGPAPAVWTAALLDWAE
jgi:hypothetical protein